MSLRRTSTVLVVAVTVLAATGTGVVGADGTDRQTAESLGSGQVDTDTVLLNVDVAADGSARWTIEYLVRLEDDNDTDAFGSLSADVATNTSQYTRRFADRIGTTVAGAENRTGREMSLRNVSVATERQDIGREYGVVRYTFTWTGFAATNETAIRVGDVLAGFYLDGQTRLTVAWPDGYRVAAVSSSPSDRRDRAVSWAGPLDFGRDGPRLALTNRPPPDDGVTRPWVLPLVAAGVAALGLLAGLGWVARRRGLVGGTDPAQGGTDAAADSGDDGGDGPPEELLSNEERVLRLLAAEGGRIKQKEVADRLDWTDAKTSQVVGGLHDEGEIEKFRLGRENVLSLPDQDDT